MFGYEVLANHQNINTQKLEKKNKRADSKVQDIWNVV